MSTYSGIPVAIISQAPRQNAEAEAAHLATPIRSLSLHQSPQDGAGGDRTRSSYVVTQASTLLHHGKLKCGMRRPWCMQCLLTVPRIARGALICGGRVRNSSQDVGFLWGLRSYSAACTPPAQLHLG